MFAAVAGTALVALVATWMGVAGALGHWFDIGDPLATNLVLTAISCGPLAFALVQSHRARHASGASKELRRLSRHDLLTGLQNRVALPDVLGRGLNAARGVTMQAAALFCDLDRFKLVNDTYGHEVGDRLMVSVADRLRDAIAPAGVAVRYGGDEFVVVHPVSGRSEAERIASKIIRALEAPFEIGTDTVRISVSVGVALSDDTTASGTALLHDADIAMYQAKAIGPGAVCVFDHSMRSRLSRATAESRLREAIDKGEMSLRYEPILGIRDGDLVGVRAQLHWEDPQRGAVPAKEFLPALEETGLVVEVGSWAIREACRHAHRWRDMAPERGGLEVTVAVSARQLSQANFRDLVAVAAQDARSERTQLCLAVTDGSLAEDITDAWTMLRHVRTLGVQVALEGFGGGASTVSNLRRVLLDQLGIDRTLVMGLDHGSEDAAIVEHLVELAHRLGMVAVAADVDSASQLAQLRRVGCDRARGPFLGMALPVQEIDLLVLKARADDVPTAPQTPTFTPAPAHSMATVAALPRMKPYV
ncbi:MAG TPA: EAL domain-containing protein [Acidimicrobiales bacterium]